MASDLRLKNAGKIVKLNFPVLEMSCAGCAISVESILKSAPGVEQAAVNFANQSASVAYDAKITTPAKLQQAVRSIGYDLIIDIEDPQGAQEVAQRAHYERIKIRTIGSFVLSIPVVMLGMFFMTWEYSAYLSMVLTTPVIFYFGRDFFMNAWKQARHGRANMDTLVALSTGIAFLFSVFNTFSGEFWHSRGLHAHVYYEAVTVVITFISAGKWMEERAKSSTSSAIKKLMGLQSKTVHALVNGADVELPLASINIGDTIIVRGGEKIPLDGVVLSGDSFVDESMISGEPIAVEKKKGSSVLAGTINQHGSLQFEARTVASDTLLAQIIRQVQDAQGSKAPVQKLVDKIAGIFVPVVMGISALTFITWMILGGEQALTHALLTSITVLVIACPCALGLATPTAIMVGIGKGATHGILIKDAESLELAHSVNAVVLDKTGTITTGKPAITEIVWEDGADIPFLKRVLYTMESQSGHPLGEAIANYFKHEGTESIFIQKFESITGHGIQATVDGKLYFVGKKNLVQQQSVSLSFRLEQQAARFQDSANTVIYFANGTNVLAILAIADHIKPTSAEAVRTLLVKGIQVYMLTGDNEQTAQVMAKQAGIKNYRADFLPGDKAKFIRSLQQDGKTVAMAGDGINDSEALAQADVSIAMGKGSDIAMDVAKITLITSDLQAIPKALRLSTLTVKGIRQNLFLAFVYNIIAIPVAAGILYPVNGFLLDPAIAGAAMALSSVSVVVNSLRLQAMSIQG